MNALWFGNSYPKLPSPKKPDPVIYKEFIHYTFDGVKYGYSEYNPKTKERRIVYFN